MKTLLMVALAVLVAPTLVLATTPYPYVSDISFNANTEVSVFVTPEGTGSPLSQCFLPDGSLIDATITVHLVTIDYAPIAQFPHEDVWLETESDQQNSCVLGFCADGPSDPNGEMTFSGTLAGGGWHEGPTYVYVNGNPALDPLDYPWPSPHAPLPLRFNSPDINGDGLVNLVDVSLFSVDFFGPYAYRSDYNWDGVLNLTDLGWFASALGTGCD